MINDALQFGALLATVFASSGFWNWVTTRNKTATSSEKLLLGLAHDRIVFLGMSFVDRGWITKDEYEDFFKYLYTPYADFGGNGLAEKVMNDVKSLPLRNSHNKTEVHQVKEIFKDEHDWI